jgi:hypothetical protein
VPEPSTLVVHRLGFGRALAWFFVLVGIGAAVGGLVAAGASPGLRLSSVLAGAALVLVSWLLGLRPRVAEEPTRLVVQNLLRDAEIPWGAVQEVTLSDVVVIDTHAGPVRCYALPRKGRPLLQIQGSAILQASAPAPPAPHDPGPPPRGRAGPELVGRLEDLAAALGPAAPGEPVIGWSVPAVSAVAATVALVVGALVLR